MDGDSEMENNWITGAPGRRIGRTTKVFVNGRGEPEYIGVKMGFFGFKTVLLPVQSVVADEERRVLSLQ